MTLTSRTLSTLAALILATLSIFLVATAQSPAAAAPAGPIQTFAADEFDGFCDDPNDLSDPDCVDEGEEGGEGDPGDGEPINGEDPAAEYDGVCDDWDDMSDPDCVDWGEEVEEPAEEILWPAPPKGAYAKLVNGSRRATIPKGAPKPVRQMIRAANKLVRKPYKWGGGHARWKDRGYDCSGAVSFVLRAGGYVNSTLTSGGFTKWGVRGAGKWVRVYAHKKHVFIVIAGLRFDTSPYGAGGGKGPRWRTTVRPTKGFKLRHPRGL